MGSGILVAFRRHHRVEIVYYLMTQQLSFCVLVFLCHPDFGKESEVSAFIPQGMGWIPDLPDARDYTYHHDAIFPLLSRLKPSRRKTLLSEVDLRCDGEVENFTLPENQGPLNCSTACAVLGLVGYFERRISGRTFEGSTRFLYKVTRNRMLKPRRAMGDTGAELRSTLKVLAQFGVPPTEYWPYEIGKFDEEPSAFLYSLAKHFPGIHYFRLDEPNQSGVKVWETIKSFLAAGFPVAFGFPVPSSLTATADIPYRPELDSVRGGQAVVAVGYSCNRFGRGQHALLIRSSWGSEWGDNGNAWLPVAFLRRQLAKNFWTLISDEWLDSGELFQPSVVESVENRSRKS